jgi:hypothetical protein
MSENCEDTPGPVEQLPNTRPTAPQLRRGLFVLKAAAVLGGAAAVMLGTAMVVQADAGAGHQDTGGSHDADKTKLTAQMRPKSNIRVTSRKPAAPTSQKSPKAK